jgi:hypothetical protein
MNYNGGNVVGERNSRSRKEENRRKGTEGGGGGGGGRASWAAGTPGVRGNARSILQDKFSIVDGGSTRGSLRR